MNELLQKQYESLHSGVVGFYENKRGLIEVSGKEAIQFLNGLITNDVGKLEDGAQMLAAFPNAQGRLLAVVSVTRQSDKFLFETEGETHEKVYNNLFRFTYAGDFFVSDLSENYTAFTVFSKNVKDKFQAKDELLVFNSINSFNIFVPNESVNSFKNELSDSVEISDELYEVLRIENGIPKYGADMSDTTIVPELGVDGLISYNKGCYIGQEIIARIYFRGHVAKQLTGLIFEDENAGVKPDDELKSIDGKNGGKISSVTFSPKLGKTIALAYIRYDYLAEDTELKLDDATAKVKNLPFI